jgi:hypothetical protein
VKNIMQVTTFEGIVENGEEIRLKTNIRLPEKTKVFVVIPDFEAKRVVRIVSPRLVHPGQAIDFKKEVVEELPNGSI